MTNNHSSIRAATFAVVALLAMAAVPAASAYATTVRTCQGDAYENDDHTYYRCRGVYKGSGESTCIGEYVWSESAGGHCTGVQGPRPAMEAQASTTQGTTLESGLVSSNCRGDSYENDSHTYYRCTGVYTGTGEAACVGEYIRSEVSGTHCTGVQGPHPDASS